MILALSDSSAHIFQKLSAYQLADLLELTYAYEETSEGHWFNKTLFHDFVDCRTSSSSQQILDAVQEKIETIQEILLQLYLSTQQAPASPADMICKHRVEYAADILRIISLGLPFEIEKAGFSHGLSDDVVAQRVQDIQRLESKRFDALVCDDSFELSRSVYQLKKLFANRKQLLTSDEQKTFKSFIKQLTTLKHYRPELEELEEPEWVMDAISLFQQKIPRDLYKHIFELSLSFYRLEIPVVIDERSSIYDGWSAMHIPDSKAYDYLTVQKVLELIQHEIETHYLIQSNTRTVLGAVRGGNNLLREEGLAKFNEEMINGATLSSFDTSPSISQLAMGEYLTGDDYKQFNGLYWKLQGIEDKAMGYFLRYKRNYSLYAQGVQHKDTTYSRGRFFVRSYLLNGGKYEDLYLSKVNFEDMDILSHALSDYDKEQLLYPAFLAERILYHFLYRESEDIGFDQYMRDKWPFLDYEKYTTPLDAYQTQRLYEIIGLLESEVEKK